MLSQSCTPSSGQSQRLQKPAPVITFRRWSVTCLRVRTFACITRIFSISLGEDPDRGIHVQTFSSPFSFLDSELERAGLADRTAPLLRELPVPATLGCISWADDCLRAATAPSLPDVVDKVQKVLQVNLELAASLGITFSFSPTKTCLLLPPVRSPVAHLASDMPTAAAPAWVVVENRVLNEVVTVPVVDDYKHLGCVLVADGSPRPEIHFRLSQALAVSRPLAFKFFSNSRYPLAVRRCMLRSLVISKYVHGSAALCLEVGAHHRQWCAANVSLWRTLCRRDPTTKKLVHAFELLAMARAASPDLALAYARAVFLQKHAVHDPPHFWCTCSRTGSLWALVHGCLSFSEMFRLSVSLCRQPASCLMCPVPLTALWMSPNGGCIASVRRVSAMWLIWSSGSCVPWLPIRLLQSPASICPLCALCVTPRFDCGGTCAATWPSDITTTARSGTLRRHRIAWRACTAMVRYTPFRTICDGRMPAYCAWCIPSRP